MAVEGQPTLLFISERLKSNQELIIIIYEWSQVIFFRTQHRTFARWRWEWISVCWAGKRAVYRGIGPVWTQGDVWDVGSLWELNRVCSVDLRKLWPGVAMRCFSETCVNKQAFVCEEACAVLSVCFKRLSVLKRHLCCSWEKASWCSRLQRIGNKKMEFYE